MDSPQYNSVLENTDAIIESLEVTKTTSDLATQFDLNRWTGIAANPTAKELVLYALVRIKESEAEFDVFIEMMGRVTGLDHVVAITKHTCKTKQDYVSEVSARTPSQVTPKMGEDKAAEIVKKAMESGCIKQRNTVAIVTGIMGAGKSTFLKRLFRRDIPSSYTSTGVTGESYRGVMGHLACLRSLEYMPRGRILKLLAPLLKLGVPEGDVEAVAQTFMDAQAVSTPRPRSASSSPIVTVATEPTYSQDTLQGLVKDESEESADCLELDLIHVLDTGGQPECMEVMPSLIHNSDLVILVLNLKQGLEYYTTPFCAEKGTRYEKSTLLQRQNKQIIRQLICTMQAKRACSNYKEESSSYCSRFLVIGTHKDCIEPEIYSDVMETCHKDLDKLFGQVVDDKQVLHKESLVFPLNLLNPKSEDENVLDDIRENLRLLDVKSFDLPLSFFMFEQDANKYNMGIEGRAVKALSLKECEEIGTRLKMSRKTVQAALLYLHKHNVFLYFQDILPNLVFLDPQEPLELVNAMVRLSYKAKANEAQPLTPYVKRCLLEGIITKQLLKHNDLSLHFVPDMYQPCDAITLFQKIYTIAPLGEAKGKKEYVMMCLLPDKTEDEIRSLLPSSPRVPPLLVHFENDCAPIGCFGNTVSCLINKYGWMVQMLKDSPQSPQCLAHNVVQFTGSPNVPVEITLVNSTEWFEVHVNTKNAQEDRHCPDISANMFSAVSDVLRTMHYNIDAAQAFRCPCDSSEPHATTEPDTAATEPHATTEPDTAATEPHAATLSTSSSTKIPEKIMCTKTKKFHDLKDEQRVWIQKTKCMGDCPTLPELMNFGEDHVDIIKEIGVTYHKFGILLLEDTYGSTMGALKWEKHGNAEDINNTVLTRWIRGEGRKPTSWATLATVLEECQLSLADVIRSGQLAQATDRQARNKRQQEGQKLTMTTICTIMVFLSAILVGLLLYSMGITQ